MTILSRVIAVSRTSLIGCRGLECQSQWNQRVKHRQGSYNSHSYQLIHGEEYAAHKTLISQINDIFSNY